MLALGVAVTLFWTCPARAQCEDLIPKPADGDVMRPVEAMDLARLRDIGLPDSALFAHDEALSVAPDGSSIAFVLRRADPARNTYCQGLIVVPASAHSQPRLLDTSIGFLAEAPLSIRGLVTRSGMPAVNTPRWSPDGRLLAWIKPSEQSSQAWIVEAASGAARQLSNLADDVKAVAWSDDGRTLLVTTRPGLGSQARAAAAIDARSGFLYDDRFMPAQGFEPRVPEPVARAVIRIDVASGRLSHGEPVETKRVADEIAAPARTTHVVAGTSDARAWVSRISDDLFSESEVWTSINRQPAVRCPSQRCRGSIFGAFWDRAGKSLFFLRREGWQDEVTALYRWRSNGADPVLLRSTPHTLASCRIAGGSLFCLEDGARRPRRLVAINLTSGAVRDIFDPNPEFGSLKLGRVQRLRWRNALGFQARGDLVLPPDYRGDAKLPLIIVQYHSDGFLRGGTGDEYPIFAFAARGYAVLSIEQPLFFARTLAGINDWKEANRQNGIGWRERRSLLSSIDAAVDLVVEMGVADPSRIGITGLSDGATSVQFALINSTRFAAAAMSSCCIDPMTVMYYGGPRWAKELRRRGYPKASAVDAGFWAPMSLALNASRIDTPLLLQLPSDEYLLALEGFGALREREKPVEMHVFADERHVKSQPAHRLAIYERNLDWFDFWLLRRTDSNPLKRDQYKRWNALRANLGGASSEADAAP